MHKYCFEFQTSAALTDREQVEIANGIRAIAKVTCGLQIRECSGLAEDKVFDNVLDEAKHLVYGDRNDDYGHPLDDFSCAASMWTAYLRHRGVLQPDAVLTAEDVPMMMINIKQSRYANSPKRDNVVDIAGYAGTVDMCSQRRDVIAKADGLHLVDTLPALDDASGD